MSVDDWLNHDSLQVEAGQLTGPPREVINALLDEDESAGMLCKVLVDFEKTIQEKGWEQPWRIIACLRSLPPPDIAEQMQEHHGLHAQLVAMSEIPMPGIMQELPPHVAMHVLATMLADPKSNSLQELVYENEFDVLAWAFLDEVWVAQQRQDDVQPRDDPDRVEIRMVIAVDRVGFRYQVYRQRESDRVLLSVDRGQPGGYSTGGRLMDALTSVMDATDTQPHRTEGGEQQ